MARKALITGISGQDGAYLAEYLLHKGYDVVGSMRRGAGIQTERLRILGIENDVEFVDLEVLEQSNIVRVLEKAQPDEVYNLAAQSFVGSSFNYPLYTADVTGLSVLRILEAIRNLRASEMKFYQASTSEMFGKVLETPQTENTPFNPQSPYGISKLFGHFMTVNYRESYGLFAVSGILFNHESPLRGEEFVTKKIVKQMVEIKIGKRSNMLLGNLDSQRDWGYAGDYVKAMYGMLQLVDPTDLVIATGQTCSVREFIEKTADLLQMEIVWEGSGENSIGRLVDTNKIVVKCDKKYFRPSEVHMLVGDSSMAAQKLNWYPEVQLEGLVEMMVNYELAES